MERWFMIASNTAQKTKAIRMPTSHRSSRSLAEPTLIKNRLRLGGDVRPVQLFLYHLNASEHSI